MPPETYPPAESTGSTTSRWHRRLDLLQHGAWLCAALVFGLAVITLTQSRLSYGVDFTDESFYIALPYRFAMGDLPLRDEQNLAQFAGLLTFPLVKAYMWATHGLDGLVLFMRHMHLLFTAVVAAVVYAAARTFVPRADAIVAACLCMAFVPFTIHGLSYNTLGCGLLTAALFLAARDRDQERVPLWFCIGLLQALAALVYQTLFLGALVFVAINFAGPIRNARYQGLLAYVAGALLVVASVASLVVVAGVESIPAIGRYLAGFHMQGGGAAKLLHVTADFATRTPRLFALLLTGAALVILKRRNPASTAPAALVLPALLYRDYVNANGSVSLYLVTAIACIAPFIQDLVDRRAQAAALMRTVWWPSMACGLVTAWSSSNGAMNASIGAFPAAVCSMVLLQMFWAQQGSASFLRTTVARAMALGTPAMLVAALLAGDHADYYGEKVQRPGLTQQVLTGPYRGLVTTPEKYRQLEEVRTRIVPLLAQGDRALVFDGLPGGYLLLGLPVGANSVWLPPAAATADRTTTLDYWRTRKAATVAFVTPQAAATGDPLLRALADRQFAPAASVELGTLLRRPNAGAAQDSSRR